MQMLEMYTNNKVRYTEARNTSRYCTLTSLGSFINGSLFICTAHSILTSYIRIRVQPINISDIFIHVFSTIYQIQYGFYNQCTLTLQFSSSRLRTASFLPICHITGFSHVISNFSTQTYLPSHFQIGAENTFQKSVQSPLTTYLTLSTQAISNLQTQPVPHILFSLLLFYPSQTQNKQGKYTHLDFLT